MRKMLYGFAFRLKAVAQDSGGDMLTARGIDWSFHLLPMIMVSYSIPVGRVKSQFLHLQLNTEAMRPIRVLSFEVHCKPENAN